MSAEFLRFLVVGGTAAVAGWVLLYVGVGMLGLHYVAAFVLTFLLVNGLAFLANGRFAFLQRGATGAPALLRYNGISVLSLFANTLVLHGLVEYAGLHYLRAAILLSALNAPINFLVQRRITYRMPLRMQRTP